MRLYHRNVLVVLLEWSQWCTFCAAVAHAALLWKLWLIINLSINTAYYYLLEGYEPEQEVCSKTSHATKDLDWPLCCKVQLLRGTDQCPLA